MADIEAELMPNIKKMAKKNLHHPKNQPKKLKNPDFIKKLNMVYSQ